MLRNKRQDTILQYLKDTRLASVKDIVKIADASEATIRRDLNTLEEQGKIERVHGGARLLPVDGERQEFMNELPFDYRKGHLIEKKRRIAQAAASLCEDGETIMIDGGSTTYQMVDFLKEKKLQIITNSFAIAEFLNKYSQNTITIIGGMIYHNSQLILNPFTYKEFLSNYYASRLFMGVGGIDSKGASNTEMLLIQTERVMIQQSKELIIMCDSSKFEKHANIFLCDFNSIGTIITDSDIKPEHETMILEKKIRLILV